MKVGGWVCCGGKGHRHETDGVNNRLRHFPENAVGKLKELDGDTATVWLIGKDMKWDIRVSTMKVVNVLETGDEYARKICNKCHCLLPVKQFAIDQRNTKRHVRRPTCKQCRTDIDKRAPKTRQAKEAEKRLPKRGTEFRCLICDKRSIAGVTARIVADHNHHTGDIRDFICDSCNTGLGRFKNGRNCLLDAARYIEARE